MRQLRKEIDLHLQKTLSSKRYEHCLGTEKAAIKLADKFGVSKEICSIAGLSHDICREMEGKELKKITSRDHETPVLLHGEAGSIILREKFRVADPQILNAVKYHISGSKDLDIVGKIIFAADYTEEGRTHLDDRERERLFSLDLDDMVFHIAVSIKNHLEFKGLPIDKDLSEMIEVLS